MRNWLMLTIAVQCGLRRGELLKLRLDDLPRAGDPGLTVRRRPGDAADIRPYQPSVKTVERVVAVSDQVRNLLRVYLSAGPPTGRRPGRSPYLFVAEGGAPLSIPAADDLLGIVRRHTGIADLSWHSFRHTWAESCADELLEHRPEEETLALLRELGGWKRGSSMPAHYIRNALMKRANAFLRERNARLYGSQRP